jgi:multicomponent Na+:H+ antiporter subunit F
MTPLLPAPVLIVATALVGGAFVLALLRLLRGPTSTDRVVALDFMSAVAAGAAGLQSLATGSDAFLRVATILALLGFLGTVALATYLERRAT